MVSETKARRKCSEVQLCQWEWLQHKFYAGGETNNRALVALPIFIKMEKKVSGHCATVLLNLKNIQIFDESSFNGLY